LRHLLPFFIFLLLLAVPAGAVVEIARNGKPPVTIDEVYLRNGVPYLAIEDVLAALSLRGEWSSVQHQYWLKTSSGTAIVSPGSHFVRLASGSHRLSDPPSFIDNRLRVPEDFVQTLLPRLLDEEIHYRNLQPASVATEPEESPLDRLFSFLLLKERGSRSEPALRAILLDPGHGGSDPGSLGAAGTTEKAVALDVARRLEKLLKMRLDIPVYLSRDGDYTLAPQQRLEAAGRADIDAMLLLHAQSALSPAVRGVTLVVRPREEGQSGSPEMGEGGSIRLARHLAQALRQAGLPVAGIVRAPMLPLGRGNLPTVLVELGYLTNEEDRTMLRDAAGQDRLAEALYTGISNFAEEEKKEQVNAKR
jgi:N-acetylmuramoyl-L-alanine amidase